MDQTVRTEIHVVYVENLQQRSQVTSLFELQNNSISKKSIEMILAMTDSYLQSQHATTDHKFEVTT
jgi:hypothetical protein